MALVPLGEATVQYSVVKVQRSSGHGSSKCKQVLKVFLNEGHSIGVFPTADTVVIEDAKYSLGLLSTGGRMSWPHGTKWSPDKWSQLPKQQKESCTKAL